MPSGSKKVVYAALFGNAAIMVMKFIAAFNSDSSAMFAEAFHSIADTGNQALMLLGIFLSKKPADEKHPFGYGKERYFWSFIVAVSMFSIGATYSVYSGIEKILHPQPIFNVHLSFFVLGFAGVFEFLSWSIAATEFQKLRHGRTILRTLEDTRDPAVINVLFEDTAALIGILIAACGIWLTYYRGLPIFDGVASVCIGLMLVIVALLLSLESRDFLLGESASRRDRASIRKVLHDFAQVERIVDLLTMHISPDEILINAKIEFRDEMTTEEIEKTIDDIQAGIRKRLPQVKKIFIEADTPKESVKSAPPVTGA